MLYYFSYISNCDLRTVGDILHLTKNNSPKVKNYTKKDNNELQQ